MTITRLALAFCAVSVSAVSIQAQQNLVLGRVLGQNSLTSIYTSAAPNIVEGREMTSPQSVALDTSASPPIAYVSDTGNNRVLAWHDASSFNSGAFADFAIGQKDLVSNGYGSGKDGLREPGGLVVDAQGNLWVMDAHNSRILRFPKPFSQTAPAKMADLVIGQPGFTTTDANHGGISATSLSLVVGGGSMAFDSSGNLWVTDSANHRVLRYPVDPANAGKVLTTADRVLGQTDFASKKYTTNVTNASQFNTPSGLAIDGSGRLYVSDAAHRVLVFNPNTTTATQFAGELLNLSGPNVNGPLSPPSDQSLNAPESVTINAATGEVLVSDTGNNRVLVFPPIGQWPAQGQPKATSVIGQPDFTTNKKGVSATVLSAPVHVARTSTEFFVVDSLNNRVVVFPQGSKAATRVLGQRLLDAGAPNLIEGKELYIQGLLPVGSGTYQPVTGGLAMDTTGAVPHLYIADAGNNRVLGYCDARRAKQGDKADLVIGQPDLLHAAANGDGGTTPNDQNLWLPSGLVVDAGGNLFVSDTGNGRVLRFAAPCAQPQDQQSFPHANLVLGQNDFKTHDTDTNPTTLGAPFGLALTKSEGHLLVSDIFQNRILRFDKPQGGDFSNGQSASAVFGQADFYTVATGTGQNQFGAVRHIAEDQSGRLYVADSGNNRIMVFSDSAPSNSTAALVFNSTTSATAHLNGPYGVYVSKNTGELWVTELNSYSNGRLRVLKYPAYDSLAFNQVSTGQFDVASPGLAVTLDANDNVVITEAANRVSEYFPAVNPLNGANWIPGRVLAPGLIASVFAKYQASPASPLAFPLPRDLGGVQVYVNGTASPLFYVGNFSAFPGYVQINFQIPSSVPSTGVVDTQVVEAATGQVLGAGNMMMKAAAPAFFTTNGQGTGQVVAVNKNNMSCNGAVGPKTKACPNGTRPVHRGETLMLFLTGQGAQSGGPADGTVASGAIRNDSPISVLVVGTRDARGGVTFSGVPAGAVAGLWEIDVEVPNNNVAVGGPNPVGVLYRDVPSEPVTVTNTFVWID